MFYRKPHQITLQPGILFNPTDPSSSIFESPWFERADTPHTESKKNICKIKVHVEKTAVTHNQDDMHKIIICLNGSVQQKKKKRKKKNLLEDQTILKINMDSVTISTRHVENCFSHKHLRNY